MPATLPIKDMKDTAAFTHAVQTSSTPIIVTRNGSDAFVAMSCEAYEAIEVDCAKMRLYERMELAEREYSDGRYEDGALFTSRMRQRYGI